MTRKALELILDGLDGEALLKSADLTALSTDVLMANWSAAAAEARDAYAWWSASGGGEAFAVYRATADRADAAQDALAARALRATRTTAGGA